MGEIHKSYYAIIPANVRYDIELAPNAKLLYGEITALSNERGYCWASNDYFAGLYKVTDRQVRRWIKSLVDAGYITSDITYKPGTKEVDKRYLRIAYCNDKKDLTPTDKKDLPYGQKRPEGEDKKDLTPTDKKDLYNNTSFNNTKNNTLNNKESVDDVFENYASGALLEALNDFKEFRKEIKSTITLKAAKMIIKKLDALGKDDYEKIKIIEQSIENGYKGLFPLKNQNAYNKPIQPTMDPMSIDMSYLERGVN